MTLLEYIKSLDPTGEAVYSDEWSKEDGFYADLNRLLPLEWAERLLSPFLKDYLGRDFFVPDNADNIRYINGAVFEFLNKTELVIDKEVSDYRTTGRRPYFWLRGKRVTEEQAFDIIRRTDRFFQWHMATEQTVDILHFPNWWFSRDHIPTHYGWCHPSGIIGLNGITDRFPDLQALLSDMMKLKYAFPYLDLAAAITRLEEVPPDAWDRRKQTPDLLESLEIEIGIWLHDGTIEFMEPKRTQQVYKEYEAKYSEVNADIYMPEYYEDHNIFTADMEYLRRCIAANGLDPYQALSTVNVSVWKNRKR